MGKKSSGRFGWLFKLLGTVLNLIFIALILWHGLTGAVLGGIIFAVLDRTIWHGILIGAGLKILYFFFGGDSGLFLQDGGGGDDGERSSWEETDPVDPSITLGKHEVGRQIVIHTPVDKVFNYAGDFSYRSKWDFTYLKVEQLSPNASGVGAKFKVKENALGAAEVITLEFTEWIPNQKFTYCFSDQHQKYILRRIGGCYLFHVDAAGDTIVTHIARLEGRSGGWLKKPHEFAVASHLVSLKEELEKSQRRKN